MRMQSEKKLSDSQNVVEIFLDVETTGPSAKKHAMIEATFMLHDMSDSITVSMRPHYSAEINEFALSIIDITKDELFYRGDPKEAAKKIVDWLGKYKKVGNIVTLYAHNSRFDISFIGEFLRRYGYTFTELYDREIDTIEEFKKLVKRDRYNLKDMCESFGIINKAPHSSEGDTVALIELYDKVKRSC